MAVQTAKRTFIDPEGIRDRIERASTDRASVERVIAKALELKGLRAEDAAVLLKADSPELERLILGAAGRVKELIYGRRLVLFAPLYIGNSCSNNCLYCSFRAGNKAIVRRSLSMDEIELEVRALLREGHKRILMLDGEDARAGHAASARRFASVIEHIYSVREAGPKGGAPYAVRRVNVEVAPLDVEGFRTLGSAKIGTYICFQETYDPDLYAVYHRTGPKADYEWRLNVMDRAMEAGIKDVGIGALFGLGDFRFEVLAMLEHARHLEEVYGCGPHTVSVPRIEPAEGAPAAMTVPKALSDREFRLVVATLRLALPYTGIILSTRESEEIRNELFRYGVSQISAGSRTNPGAYDENVAEANAGGQFQLGDHRSLEEVVGKLAEMDYVPSFCTGCYRKGRVGEDFMDLAKPGLIKRFCEPNALFTFAEYLRDFAGAETVAKSVRMKEALIASLPDEETRRKTREALGRVEAGESDIYF